MAEPRRAPIADPTLTVEINAQLECVPVHGHVDNNGQVNFRVAAALTNGCLIHTSPARAFEGEAPDGYITLQPGQNGPFTPAVQDETITYCTCLPGKTCNPFESKETGGNTIGVGQTEGPGSH